jgi:hypothetical protein
MSGDVVLAGKAADLGNSLIGTIGTWADRGLQVALVAIVVITVIRKASLKAGIGALIGLVLALGIYNSRGSLANLFEDEVNNPAGAAGVVTVLDGSPDRRGGPGGAV